MDIKIEKGIPIPNHRYSKPTDPLCEVFLRMEIGDSIVLSTEREVNIVRSWLHYYKKHHPEYNGKVVGRKLKDGTHRLWKVDNNQ